MKNIFRLSAGCLLLSALALSAQTTSAPTAISISAFSFNTNAASGNSSVYSFSTNVPAGLSNATYAFSTNQSTGSTNTYSFNTNTPAANTNLGPSIFNTNGSPGSIGYGTASNVVVGGVLSGNSSSATFSAAGSNAIVAMALLGNTNALTTAQQAVIANALTNGAVGPNTLDSANANANTYGGSLVTLGRSVQSGSGASASGFNSHAEGENVSASGEASHVEGYNSRAQGFFSHAEGNGTTASYDEAHAEGGGTTASGVAAHAEGNGTVASGGFSHAQGSLSVASASITTAGGFRANAVHNYSYVMADQFGATSSVPNEATLSYAGGIRLLRGPIIGNGIGITNLQSTNIVGPVAAATATYATMAGMAGSILPNATFTGSNTFTGDAWFTGTYQHFGSASGGINVQGYPGYVFTFRTEVTNDNLVEFIAGTPYSYDTMATYSYGQKDSATFGFIRPSINNTYKGYFNGTGWTGGSTIFPWFTFTNSSLTSANQRFGSGWVAYVGNGNGFGMGYNVDWYYTNTVNSDQIVKNWTLYYNPIFNSAGGFTNIFEYWTNGASGPLFTNATPNFYCPTGTWYAVAGESHTAPKISVISTGETNFGPGYTYVISHENGNYNPNDPNLTYEWAQRAYCEWDSTNGNFDYYRLATLNLNSSEQTLGNGFHGASCFNINGTNGVGTFPFGLIVKTNFVLLDTVRGTNRTIIVSNGVITLAP